LLRLSNLRRCRVDALLGNTLSLFDPATALVSVLSHAAEATHPRVKSFAKSSTMNACGDWGRPP
jgi:hypothetical protein